MTRWLSCMAALVAALGPQAGGAEAQSGRLWRPEERVLVSAFHQLAAVATDTRRVYAASPEGVVVFDQVSRRWEPPLTLTTGFPVGEQPTALAFDVFTDALWMGTAMGSLYAYRPHFGRWDALGAVAPGGIRRIVPGPGSHEPIYIATTAGGWLRLERGSAFADRIPPGQVPPEVLAEAAPPLERLSRMDPYFESAGGLLTRDEHLRRWRITDVAPADQPLRFWLATDGGQLLYYDSRRMDADRMRFGLLNTGAGAVAADGPDIWFGGDGRGFRRGAAVSDADFQRWRQYEANYDGAPGGHVRAILPTSGAVWFAASDGLFRYDRERRDWRRLREADGLPDGQVTALAAAPGGGVWAGTRRGAARFSEAGEAESVTLLPNVGVNALLLSRDTLWLATQNGVWMLVSGAGQPVRAPGSGEVPLLRGPVMDVRPYGGELLVLTEDALFRMDGEGWHGPFREVAQAGLGRLRGLAAAESHLWVAGERGVGRLDGATGQWTYHLTRQDIPEGPVHGVLPAGDHVWIATGAGALRLTWRDR